MSELIVGRRVKATEEFKKQFPNVKRGLEGVVVSISKLRCEYWRVKRDGIKQVEIWHKDFWEPIGEETA